MITEEDYQTTCGGPPEMAFVRLEEKFRAAYHRNLSDSDGNVAFYEYTVEYMNHVVAAAMALGIDLDLSDFWVGTPSQNEIYKEYRDFRREIDKFVVQTRIAHIRTESKNSFALDPSEKKRIRAYADTIKEIIDNSSLEAAKKERLFDKINSFVAELDRDRTSLQKFNEAVLSLAHTGGEAAAELEPAWKWVKQVFAIFGVHQEAEQSKLPAPPKKLEAPKTQPALPKKNAKSAEIMDDEIPF